MERRGVLGWLWNIGYALESVIAWPVRLLWRGIRATQRGIARRLPKPAVARGMRGWLGRRVRWLANAAAKPWLASMSIYLLVVATGAVVTLLRRVDATLQQMHLDSGTSGSALGFPVKLGDLRGTIVREPAQKTADEIRNSWAAYDAKVAGRTFVAAQERDSKSCFPPIFVQIDNSSPASTVSTAADPRPVELLAPVGVTLGQVGSRESYARARAAAAFSRAVSSSGLTVKWAKSGATVEPVLWFRISLFGQPGPRPPLGWTLAPQTVADMRSQLNAGQNATQIKLVHQLLAKDALRCE